MHVRHLANTPHVHQQDLALRVCGGHRMHVALLERGSYDKEAFSYGFRETACSVLVAGHFSCAAVLWSDFAGCWPLILLWSLSPEGICGWSAHARLALSSLHALSVFRSPTSSWGFSWYMSLALQHVCLTKRCQGLREDHRTAKSERSPSGRSELIRLVITHDTWRVRHCHVRHCYYRLRGLPLPTPERNSVVLYRKPPPASHFAIEVAFVCSLPS